jgi:hypothetical protein
MIIDSKTLKENAQLVQKYQNLIEATDNALKESAAYGAMSNSQRNNLAIELENISNMIETKAPKILTESGTQVVDIAKKMEYLNLTSAIMPTLVIEDVVSVQAQKQKVATAFYVRNKFGSDRGKISRGDNISSFLQVGPDANKIPDAFNYSSETISDEVVVPNETTGNFTLAWNPVVPGSVSFKVSTATYTDDGAGNIIDASKTNKGTIDYTTGIVSFTSKVTIVDNMVSYSQDMETSPINVPEVGFDIGEVVMIAKPRKLRGSFSMDAAFDLAATQNIDLQSLLQDLKVDEIRSEIDGEILNDILNSGTGMNVTFNIAVPFGITKVEQYDSFLQTIIQGANKVRTKTRRVTPNIIIVGETGANILECMTKFKPASTLGSAGPHIIGTLDNRFLCIYSPYYGANQGVLAYKGDLVVDTGYIYGPYMPIMATQYLMSSNFSGDQRNCYKLFKEASITRFLC